MEAIVGGAQAPQSKVPYRTIDRRASRVAVLQMRIIFPSFYPIGGVILPIFPNAAELYNTRAAPAAKYPATTPARA
jgi:hypothetical protein